MADQNVTVTLKSGSCVNFVASNSQTQNLLAAFDNYIAKPTDQPLIHMQVKDADLRVVCAEISAIFAES